MTLSPQAIAGSYAFCQQTTRRSGSNFYPCFMMLPRAKRRAMEALYAFLRFTDDLADCPKPLHTRRESLVRWRDALSNALDSQDVSAQFQEPQHGCLGAADTTRGESLLPALADTVRRYGIPREHLFAVIDGVEVDLRETRFETFDELAEYCHLVASAVGLACVHIWGFQEPLPEDRARQCGLAFQLTNILRDVAEDAGCGRVYLPQDEMRTFGCEEAHLVRPSLSQPLERLLRMQIDRARSLYESGAGLYEYLNADGRRVFGMMWTTYHNLLDQIDRNLPKLLSQRIGLSRRQKLHIAVAWLLLPPRRNRLP